MDLFLLPLGRACHALAIASLSPGFFLLTQKPYDSASAETTRTLSKTQSCRKVRREAWPSLYHFSATWFLLGLDLQLNSLGKRKPWKMSWVESQETWIFPSCAIDSLGALRKSLFLSGPPCSPREIVGLVVYRGSLYPFNLWFNVTLTLIHGLLRKLY